MALTSSYVSTYLTPKTGLHKIEIKNVFHFFFRTKVKKYSRIVNWNNIEIVY